jgi:hypothetical protein
MLASQQERLDQLIYTGEDMNTLLPERPPDAVHGAPDGSLLWPMKEFVRFSGFRETHLSNGDVLWLRPEE